MKKQELLAFGFSGVYAFTSLLYAYVWRNEHTYIVICSLIVLLILNKGIALKNMLRDIVFILFNIMMCSVISISFSLSILCSDEYLNTLLILVGIYVMLYNIFESATNEFEDFILKKQEIGLLIKVSIVASVLLDIAIHMQSTGFTILAILGVIIVIDTINIF